MIYVNEKDFNRQIELVTFMSSLFNLNICAWLYPDSNITTLSKIKVINNPLSLIPPTLYEDGITPKCTELLIASNENIKKFEIIYPDLKKYSDSLALYKNNELDWFFVTIGHEEICLIKDDSLLMTLLQAGYSASLNAPDWW